jgi:uncharacterized protein YhaN
MRFETAEIDRYGPLKGCRPPCDDGITVVAGPNESGKTLYLEALLQLLEPDVAAQMDPGPRVEQSPVGRVVVDDGNDRHALGDGTRLSDVSRIEPGHLYNLFVVRDSDLALPDGSNYYASLVEHLGDIHTTEIEAIRERLVDEGRLTASRLDLANRQYDTKDVRNDAASLAEAIESYLETVEGRGIGDAVRERLRLRSELSTVEADLETQRTAGAVAAFEDASEQFETYADATEAIRALSAFDAESLERLRERDREISQVSDRIERLERRLEAKRDEVETYRERRAAARDRRGELEQREGDVDDVEAALDAYRDRASAREDGGFDARLRQRRYVAVAGLVGAGLAAGGGAIAGSVAAILLAVGLFTVALAAGLSHYRRSNRIVDSETLERELLQRARDAGFEVEAAAEVAPRVREYRDELERAGSRVAELEAKFDQAEQRVEALVDDLETATARTEELRDELTAALEADGADSLEAYESRVDEKAAHERRRSEAELVLARELGAPDAADPEAKLARWRSELAEWEADVGEAAVDADRYDEAALERLEARRAELDDRIEALEAELADYRERLAEFERRATELSPPPFVETAPSLAARTDEGLRELAGDLREVVESIERNAEVSEKAITLLDGIKADEQQKVATLFDPDGPASRLLSHLTDGRYAAVDYDPVDETLTVTTADGRRLATRRLSRGTRDQLYFAARLSLADQLLGGDPGFLLLDDPFLAADRTRLRNGFESLEGLADDGWQIVYLTAKPEVHEGMAASFDCTVHELEPLEH